MSAELICVFLSVAMQWAQCGAHGDQSSGYTIVLTTNGMSAPNLTKMKLLMMIRMMTTWICLLGNQHPLLLMPPLPMLRCLPLHYLLPPPTAAAIFSRAVTPLSSTTNIGPALSSATNFGPAVSASIVTNSPIASSIVIASTSITTSCTWHMGQWYCTRCPRCLHMASHLNSLGHTVSAIWFYCICSVIYWPQ